MFGEQETGGDEEAASLPPLQEGESLPISNVELLEKQTKPKPLHTESSLLAAMENAGKELEDAELKASLKDAGIGTPATRAAIIETLFARQYIVREKKNLVPTDKGLAVYGIVKDKKIADVEMTGMWETALSKIEAGNMDADTFRKGIEVYATQITTELLSEQLSVATGETCPCPKCNNGRILFYPKVAKCSNVDCTLTIFRNKCDKQLSDKQIVELVTKRKTGLIKGFKGKNGKAFDASLGTSLITCTSWCFSHPSHPAPSIAAGGSLRMRTEGIPLLSMRTCWLAALCCFWWEQCIRKCWARCSTITSPLLLWATVLGGKSWAPR